MNLPTIDLHCDLLFYLNGGKGRTPYDLAARCAIPQLRKGSVKLQTMAVFTQTESLSLEIGLGQIRHYQNLPTKSTGEFIHFTPDFNVQSSSIALLIAFENASGFCNEKEPLQLGIDRLNTYIREISKPLYISLTWNTENRFGGGALTQIGLKEDGKLLLIEMDQHKIPIDLSHASDPLAYDILDFIEGKGLSLPVIASHSNARAVVSMPRNLSDEIAKEIIRKRGVIGLNLFRHFIGDNKSQILNHVSHWLEIGAENQLALGADFFYDPDLPSSYRYGKEVFFEEYQNSSCYGSLFSFVQKELKLSPNVLEKFSHQNALNFIKGIFP